MAIDRVRADPLAPILDAEGTVILDGGLATQLEAQGADLSDPLWSARLLLEDPDEIVRAHLAFFRAGARVATTASYQASFEGFGRRGIAREAAVDLLQLSVRLAERARDRYVSELAPVDPGPLLVAASIGPYGATLADGSEYRGRYGRSTAELAAFHRERMAVLAGSGADLLGCETIPELEEGVAIADLLDELGADGWLSFTCSDGARLRSGAPVEEAFGIGDAAAGVLAVGINCTAPQFVDELLDRARTVTGKPIVVYPNSGEQWDAASREWRRPADMTDEGDVGAATAERWVAAGARLVGGCCRVTPATIASITRMVADRQLAPGAGDRPNDRLASVPSSSPISPALN